MKTSELVAIIFVLALGVLGPALAPFIGMWLGGCLKF